MDKVLRFKGGEAVVGVWIVAWSLALWWGTGFFRGNAPFLVFAAGLVLSAIGFTALNIVEDTNANIRRIVVAGSFLAAIPLALLGAGVWGLGAVVCAVLLLETVQMRASRFRNSLRYVRTFTLARFLLPEYFSAISLVLAAVILVSPLGVTMLENPLPENIVRTVLQWANVASIQFPPQVDLRNPEVRKQFSQLAGVTVESDDDIAAVISKIVSGQTRKLEEQHGDIYRLTFFLGTFGLLRVFGIALSWLVMPFLYLFLWTLKSLRRVSLVEEPSVRSVMKWE